MIFVNMLDDAGCKTYRTEKQGAIPFVVKDSGIVENVNIGLTKNNTLEVVQGNQGLFGKGLLGDDKEIYLADKLPTKVNSNLTFAQVKETEDNPLIIVLCKSIEVFDGVLANIQYMYIGEDAILACLIYGVCVFDGVPMSRCNTQDTQGKVSRVYKGKDILSFHDFKDKQSGYNYVWDVVCQTQINFSTLFPLPIESISGPY